ncbi:STAS domain-containing protein [Streptomyces californicus]|uniref:STAS domain-containing protein n=1 Tax=Streptomyces californicus TaxID=67351 RepID=UPI0033315B30
MSRDVTVLTIGDVLVVIVPAPLDETTVCLLQEEVAKKITEKGARGVVIDITSLDFVDTFVGNRLSSIASAAILLGARPVLVGLRPAVAQTLVQLGAELEGIPKARDLEAGLAALRSSTASSRRPDECLKGRYAKRRCHPWQEQEGRASTRVRSTCRCQVNPGPESGHCSWWFTGAYAPGHDPSRAVYRTPSGAGRRLGLRHRVLNAWRPAPITDRCGPPAVSRPAGHRPGRYSRRR